MKEGVSQPVQHLLCRQCQRLQHPRLRIHKTRQLRCRLRNLRRRNLDSLSSTEDNGRQTCSSLDSCRPPSNFGFSVLFYPHFSLFMTHQQRRRSGHRATREYQPLLTFEEDKIPNKKQNSHLRRKSFRGTYFDEQLLMSHRARLEATFA